MSSEGFASIKMVQTVRRDPSVTDSGAELALTTTRSPIRIDGPTLLNDQPAPKLGQHNRLLAQLLRERAQQLAAS